MTLTPDDLAAIRALLADALTTYRPVRQAPRPPPIDSWTEAVRPLLAAAVRPPYANGPRLTMAAVLAGLAIPEVDRGPATVDRVRRIMRALGWRRISRGGSGKRQWLYGPVSLG